MESRSADVAGDRPFYALDADAYDALITDPIAPWADAVHSSLLEAGLSRASVLDAGCGTGRHAHGLIERGHEVVLLDASEKLLEIAQRRCVGAPAYRTDICAPALSQDFDAITCRGVLNDLVADEERDAALASFARLLKPGGLLLLDVPHRGTPRVVGRPGAGDL